MGRTGITREQVFDTAATLEARGTPVTVMAVREILGTGSLSTVSHHLRDWRDRFKPAPVPSPELPEPIRQASEHALAAVWMAARDLAQAEIAAARAACDEAVALGARERAEVLATADTLEEKLAKSEETLAERDAALAQAHAEAEALRVELRALRDANANLETRAEQLAQGNGKLSATLERAHAEIQQLRLDVDVAHRERDASESSRRTLEGDLESLRAEARSLRVQLERAEKRTDEQTIRIEGLVGEHRQALAELVAERERRARADADLEEAKRAVREHEQRSAVLDGELRETRADLRARSARLEVLEHDYVVTTAKVEELVARATRAETLLAAVHDEKSRKGAE